MRIGVSCVADSAAAFRSRVRDIDSLGFERLGVGDSPAFGDVHVALGVAAEHTERVQLGPLVTNPLTRWPTVTAGAVRMLDSASGGRAFLGIGAGDSAVRASGHPMASVQTFAETVKELRHLGIGTPAGPTLILAANGPRMLGTAGALADEVLYGASLLSPDLLEARDQVRDGAERVGRDRPPGFWAVIRGWVAHDPEREASARDTLLASAANHAFAHHIPEDLPPDVAHRIRVLQRNYDFAAHGRSGANPNAALVETLGLRDVLEPRFGWVATAEQFHRRLDMLSDLGVDGVVIPAVGDHPDLLIARLGREVLPRFATYLDLET